MLHDSAWGPQNSAGTLLRARSVDRGYLPLVAATLSLWVCVGIAKLDDVAILKQRAQSTAGLTVIPEIGRGRCRPRVLACKPD